MSSPSTVVRSPSPRPPPFHSALRETPFFRTGASQWFAPYAFGVLPFNLRDFDRLPSTLLLSIFFKLLSVRRCEFIHVSPSPTTLSLPHPPLSPTSATAPRMSPPFLVPPRLDDALCSENFSRDGFFWPPPFRFFPRSIFPFP